MSRLAAVLIFFKLLSLSAALATKYCIVSTAPGALPLRHNRTEQISAELGNLPLLDRILGRSIDAGTLRSLVIKCSVDYEEDSSRCSVRVVASKELDGKVMRRLVHALHSYVAARMEEVSARTAQKGLLEESRPDLSAELWAIKKSYPWVPVSRLTEVRNRKGVFVRYVLLEGPIAFEFSLPEDVESDSTAASFKVDSQEYTGKSALIIAQEKEAIFHAKEPGGWISSFFLGEVEAEELKSLLKRKYGIGWKTPMEIAPGHW